jgi:hypothetical protein
MSTKPYKWRFAIGTTSRVPDSGGAHYLIADFDGNLPPFNKLEKMQVNNMLLQRTAHGWHLYTDYVVYDLSILAYRLRLLGADEAWIQIGYARGYYFLADKSKVVFPWPVEHMVLHYGKKQTQNT